jgi:hypothetical protein
MLVGCSTRSRSPLSSYDRKSIPSARLPGSVAARVDFSQLSRFLIYSEEMLLLGSHLSWASKERFFGCFRKVLVCADTATFTVLVTDRVRLNPIPVWYFWLSILMPQVFP